MSMALRYAVRGCSRGTPSFRVHRLAHYAGFAAPRGPHIKKGLYLRFKNRLQGKNTHLLSFQELIPKSRSSIQVLPYADLYFPQEVRNIILKYLPEAAQWSTSQLRDNLQEVLVTLSPTEAVSCSRWGHEKWCGASHPAPTWTPVGLVAQALFSSVPHYSSLRMSNKLFTVITP